MDVEKRMNLSLDAIIKEGSKKGKPRTGRPVGRRGPGKVRVEKLGRQKGRDRDQGKGLSKSQKLNQSLSKTLGVQKKGMKVQRGSRKPAAAKSESRREPKGGKARLGRNRPGRRAEASRPASRNVSKTSRVAPSGGRGSVPKRTVDLPKLTDLRITISNTQVSGAPAYSNMGAPGFQPSVYPPQPAWAAPSQVMAPQPAYGFGPRNLQPREAHGRAVPDFPVPRSRLDFGVSRRALGLEPTAARRAYKDFDDPSQNKSYMRMDTR